MDRYTVQFTEVIKPRISADHNDDGYFMLERPAHFLADSPEHAIEQYFDHVRASIDIEGIVFEILVHKNVYYEGSINNIPKLLSEDEDDNT